MPWFFGFFFVSGFCSLVYEIVWMRLAMADFGVSAAMVSIFLSSFMAGLGLGCWGGGRALAKTDPGPSYLLRCYALCELLIGLGGVLAPRLMAWQRGLLNDPASPLAWNSGGYFAFSGLCVALAVLPWAAFMGATLPLALAAIRRLHPNESERSFSYLYAANVLGAGAGALASAFFLIELLGFHGTLRAAALLNASLALAVFLASRGRESPEVRRAAAAPAARLARPRGALPLLFASGALSMAMEMVWARQYAGFLGNHVYAFASILWVYLLATFAGSRTWRAWTQARPAGGLMLAASGVVFLGLAPLFIVGSWLPMPGLEFGYASFGVKEAAALTFKASFAVGVLLLARRAAARLGKDQGRLEPALTALGACALCPLIFADPSLALPAKFSGGALRLVLGIGPFCFGAGFITSWLMDAHSGGRPQAAARAYAVNMLGCIAGPLAAGFLLLPRLGETWSLFLLAAPLLAFGAVEACGAAVLAAAFALAWLSLGVAQFQPGAATRRDATATVSAWGQGRAKMIAINGVPGVTLLVPETKMMAHLPLAFMSRPPRNALVICFGMGTTFRSALSWGIETTAVELVPSVAGFFGFFHADAPGLLASPLARVVIDDGRRFLDRSRETFDVITVDPPPPAEAPASSLLFSREFYAAAKNRLAPGGVLQTWTVPNEPLVTAAVAAGVAGTFKHVRAFLAFNGRGVHFLASDAPLRALTADALARRLPPKALADLVEWDGEPSPRRSFQDVLDEEMPLPPQHEALTDDRPVNEYFLLRWLYKRAAGAASPAF